MPREKNLTKLIPRIYKWKAENLGLYFFIKGVKSVVPTVSIESALKLYRRETGITVEEWNDDSMRATYVRLQKQFYDACSG